MRSVTPRLDLQPSHEFHLLRQPSRGAGGSKSADPAMSTPVNTAVVGDLNLCFMWLDDPFVLAVLEKLCETKNYVKRLVEGFLFFSFSFEIVKSTRNHIRNYIQCQLGNLCYAFSWQDFRSHVRRVDRIGRVLSPR